MSGGSYDATSTRGNLGAKLVSGHVFRSFRETG